MRTYIARVLYLGVIGVAALVFAAPAFAQTDGYVTNQNLRGVVPMGTYQFGEIDNINLNNGAVNLRIPLVSRKGRGMDESLVYTYSSKIWIVRHTTIGTVPVGSGFNALAWNLSQEYENGKIAKSSKGRVDWTEQIYSCTFITGPPFDENSPPPTEQIWVSIQSNFVYIGADGSQYQFPNRRIFKQGGSGVHLYNCLTPMSGEPPPPQDEMEIFIGYSASGTLQLDTFGPTYVVRFKDGRQVNTAGVLKDTNGNFSDTTGDTLKRNNFFSSSGSVLGYSITTQEVQVQTNFPTTGEPGNPNCVVQFQGGVHQTTELILPNGQKFLFHYDPTYGDLIKVTLPTGATIEYEYAILPKVDSGPEITTGSCAVGVDSRRVVKKTVRPNGTGTPAHEWLYTYVVNGQNEHIRTDVTDPTGTVTKTWVDPQGKAPPTKIETYASATAVDPLRKVENTIAFEEGVTQLNQDGTWNLAPKNYRITATKTTLETNQVSRTETTYDSHTYSTGLGGAFPNATETRMNVLEAKEYHFGAAPAGGGLARKTVLTYLHEGNANYINRYIVDRVKTKKVYDGAGTLVAQSENVFDTNLPLQTASGAVQHDYTNYPASMTYRGNLTEAKVWRNTDGQWLATKNWYDELGNLRKTQDPLFHDTFFEYTDSWTADAELPAGNTCAPVGGTAQAFVTKVKNHLLHEANMKYYSCSSLVAESKDANLQTTKFTFDFFDRPLLEKRPPGGGTTTYTFDDTNRKITRSITVGNGVNPIASEFSYDGLGRITQGRLTTDPQGTVKVDTTYDELSRKKTVSNAYRSTSDPTYGITTLEYDPLWRMKKVIPPDGTTSTNNIVTEFCGNATKVTDQAGKWRRSLTDALGRLVEVHEPNSPTATVAACPQGGDPVAVTSYTYSTLDNLTNVLQSGSRPRSFVYNSLEQLLSATNPESGTINYTYDNVGNLFTKTDARNITTTFAYDALNRLTQKSYSDTTPTVKYGYDGVAPSGCTITLTAANPTGRRTSMCDAAGTEAWTYDAMGRVTTARRKIDTVTKDFSYSYYDTGAIRALTYPSGRVITYQLTAGGDTEWAKDVANGINYATGATYSPGGALTALTNGANLVSTFFYNNRGQPCRISVKSSGTASAQCTDATNIGNVLDFTYSFNHSTTNNGNVASIANNLTPDRSQTFTYDELNRIKTAQSQATSGAHDWGLSFGYDIWANLLSATVTKGDDVPMLSQSADSNNRISGYCYDAAGNLLAQSAPPCPVPTYTYNAENQMTATAGVTYTYDGDGKRLKKSNGKLYWYGVSSDPLLETDTLGNNPDEYIFFGGKRVARRKSNGTINFYFADHLGTSRIVTSATGTVLDDSDFYPFGGERVVTTSSGNAYKFTGKERDTESGLDNFGARYNSFNLGRFMSPDPKIPSLRHLLNPQKWNKYAYTINNPLRYVDPDGMEEVEVQVRTFIPQKSVSVLGSRFAGDNRTFSTARNASSRTSITVRIETDASKRANPIISVTSTVGQTAKLDANGNVVQTATATTGVPTVAGTRDANGNVVLNFQQDTKNPLTPQVLTPGISTDLTVTVSQNASSVTAAGTTSGFPAIELNVTPEGRSTTNIPLTDPGPNASALNLFNTNTFLVSKPLPPPPPPCTTDKDKPCTNK